LKDKKSEKEIAAKEKKITVDMMTEEMREVHLAAITRYDESFGAEREERADCVEDMRFAWVVGNQWSDLEAQARKERPRFEINRVIAPINQIIGEQRQNRISMKVLPAKGLASKAISDIYSGLLKNIENNSRFADVKDNAFKEMVTCGIGAWSVKVGFEDEGFDQEIKLSTIRSAATSVYYDTAAVEENKQDAMWFIVTEDMPMSEFDYHYPGAAKSDLSQLDAQSYLAEWQQRDSIRVADYWVREPYTREIAQMSDGRIIEITDDSTKVFDELLEAGIEVVNTRKEMSYKVMHYKISAGQVLSGPHEWAGNKIPVVVVFGYNIWTSNQHYYQGMVRRAKDPQRILNYATSQAIETVALTPKDPYWVTPRQIKGHYAQMRNFNVTNAPFLTYNADPLAPGAPTRGGAPAVPEALIMQINQAAGDIEAVTGFYGASLGNDNGTDQSAQAILALQRKGNIGTHELTDNLVKAVQYTAEILIDLIPKVYDGERILDIISDDGQASPVTLNQTIIDRQSGQEVILNDLSIGKYSVVAKTGPSFETQRNETLRTLVELAKTNEVFARLSPDLIAKTLDFEGAEKLAERTRTEMINQGIEQLTEEEQMAAAQQPPEPPSPVELLQFIQLQLQTESMAANVDQIELVNSKLSADIVQSGAKTHSILTKTIAEKAEMNTKLAEGGNIQMPIEEAELAARAANLRLINDTLEISKDQAAQLPAALNSGPYLDHQMQQQQQEQGVPQPPGESPEGAGGALVAESEISNPPGMTAQQASEKDY